MTLEESIDVLKGKIQSDNSGKKDAALKLALALIEQYRRDVGTVNVPGFCQGSLYNRWLQLLDGYCSRCPEYQTTLQDFLNVEDLLDRHHQRSMKCL